MITKLFRALFPKGGAGTVTINGVEYVGNDVRIVVDGVDHIVNVSTCSLSIVVQGDVDLLETGQGNVHIDGNVNGVQTGQGDVSITGGVAGNVTTGQGNVHARLIHGNVKTGQGDIYGVNV